jgi:hypothetical protein
MLGFAATICLTTHISSRAARASQTHGARLGCTGAATDIVLMLEAYSRL